MLILTNIQAESDKKLLDLKIEPKGAKNKKEEIFKVWTEEYLPKNFRILKLKNNRCKGAPNF